MTGRLPRVSALAFGLLLLGVAPHGAAEETPGLQAAFLRGEYEKVVRATQDMLRHGTDQADGDTLLYLQGLSALKLRDFELAQTSLSRLLEEYPRSRWRGQAWLALGDGWEASGNEAKALEVYRRFLEERESADLYPQAALRLGKIQRRLGMWEEAKATLESIQAKASAGPEAAQAGEILRSGDFYFTVQVGAFVSRSNALKLAAELKRLGYEAEVSEAAMQGRIFHRVRIGRFTGRQEAEELARRLQEEGFPGRVFP